MYVRSGILLDEPLAVEKSAIPLILTAPAQDKPCYLHLDLQLLRGYTLSQLELTSSSRTTELYCSGDEYLGTAKGAVVGHCEQE